jgi:phage shock protein E
MRMQRWVLAAIVGGVAWGAGAAPPENPLIDAVAFERIVVDAGAQRAERRLDEAAFLAALREPGVVLLDARSADRYAELHVEGAVNLPFTDFTADTLAAILPRPDTRVLIYCNNNFTGSPRAFATKAPAASLNLSTWAALRAYGYENVWELGPLVSVDATQLPLVGSERVVAAGR